MTKRKVPAWVTILMIVVYTLACLALFIVVMCNVHSIAAPLANSSLAWIIPQVYAHEYAIEIVSGIIIFLVSITFIVTSYAFSYPSTLTYISLVFNVLCFLTIILLINSFASYNAFFPYPVIFLAPAITTVLSLVFLIDDIVRFEPKNAPKHTESQISKIEITSKDRHISMVAADDAFEEADDYIASLDPILDKLADEVPVSDFREEDYIEEDYIEEEKEEEITTDASDECAESEILDEPVSEAAAAEAAASDTEAEDKASDTVADAFDYFSDYIEEE